MARRLTLVEKAYNKERSRIQRQIRDLGKRGYLVPDILPKRPKRITKGSIRRLEKITRDKLYEKSRYVDQETGEILSGRSGRNLENKRRAQRAAQTRRIKKEVKKRRKEIPVKDYVNYNGQVFFTFQNEMSMIFANNPPLLQYIKRWFNYSMDKLGSDELARVLQEGYDNSEWPSWDNISDESRVVGKLSAMINRMGLSKGQEDDLIDELEQFEEWENYED